MKRKVEFLVNVLGMTKYEWMLVGETIFINKDRSIFKIELVASSCEEEIDTLRIRNFFNNKVIDTTDIRLSSITSNDLYLVKNTWVLGDEVIDKILYFDSLPDKHILESVALNITRYISVFA